MSTTDYIGYPIETDSAALAAAAIQQLMALQPGFVPNESNLEVALIEVLSTMESETRYVASLVPAEIFRYAGQSLFNIPPIDGAPATATSTWTMRDLAGYTIPANTLVAYQTTGTSSLYFRTQSEVTVPPGESTTAEGEVVLVAGEYGTAYNGLEPQTVALADALTFVVGVSSETTTAGGVDREADEAYLNRLRTELHLLSPRPILPNDFAVLALNVAGVFRAVAVDGYNPDDDTFDNERMIAVAVTDAAGDPVTSDIKTIVQSYLESLREVNFVVNVIDPNYTQVDVTATIKVTDGSDASTVLAAATQAVEDFLQPFAWPWANTLRYNQLVAVLARVPGVDYVASIVTPSQDLTLGLVASLVRPGDVRITAVDH